MVGGIITIRRLSSGYWHIRGSGPCNWAQPPVWPCSPELLVEHAFAGASQAFIASVLRELERVEGL